MGTVDTSHKPDIKLHGSTFSEEIKFYLKNYEMTQKELAMRLGLSTKHINSILNNDIVDVSVSVLEGLEYAFRLDTGILTTVYNIYSNMKLAKMSNNIEDQLKNFGLNFIIEHPELSSPFDICINEDMPVHMKLMLLKKFYGVTSLSDYNEYLKEHVLAENTKFENKANSYIWIRFCELSVEYDKFQKYGIGVFRKGLFNAVIKRVLNIMSNSNLDFNSKVKELKNYLLSKGIILVTKPFIHNSNIRGITLKKGGKRYIFLSDMYHTESYIFFALLHELVHCYYSEYTEDQIDERVIKEYKTWEVSNNTNYKNIYDAIHSYEQCRTMKQKDPKTDVSYIWDLLQDKYPFVGFEMIDSDEEVINV
ncbi:XRE family transcriptional regulator [Metamycoplasma buccale]|uniref:XRE family transcriptional regulator n=1 Tax=Metamycoplasma buccale TaxID=55602 RepID=UPI00398E6173